MEEEYIEKICNHIIQFKPDVVITEKGLSDLASHFLSRAGISAIRRLRKTDNNRIARACGATIVNRPEELVEDDVGTSAGLFEVRKLGEEFFTFIVDCKDPKACTILLRGGSKDVLNEMERNLQVLVQQRACLRLTFTGLAVILTVDLNIGCHGSRKEHNQGAEACPRWGCRRDGGVRCVEEKKFHFGGCGAGCSIV